MNLREAREKGKISQFVKEREGEKVDAAPLDRTVSSMAKRKPVEKPDVR